MQKAKLLIYTLVTNIETSQNTFTNEYQCSSSNNTIYINITKDEAVTKIHSRKEVAHQSHCRTPVKTTSLMTAAYIYTTCVPDAATVESVT